MGGGEGSVESSDRPSGLVELGGGRKDEETSPEWRRDSMADVDRLFSVTFRI